MNWNKLKRELEGFMSPSLAGRVEYKASGYRYAPGKSAQCYLCVDKKDVMNTKGDFIKWYENEQEIKVDLNEILNPTAEDIEAVRNQSGGKIPEDRLLVIAKKNKVNDCAKQIMKSQNDLLKTDFKKSGVDFLASPIEKSLESDDIMLNILAIIDRRVGKKRLLGMNETMKTKHPAVRYFYDIRRG